MTFGVNLDQTVTKSSCDMKWYRISMRIHVTFLQGMIWNMIYIKSCSIYYINVDRGKYEIQLHCKKCDEDSHGNSVSFLVATRLGGGLVQNDTKFHSHSMSFIQVLFVFHAGTLYGFWTSSSHGISMAFAKKMMGFPSDLVSFSNQTKLPSKRHEKILVICVKVN